MQWIKMRVRCCFCQFACLCCSSEKSVDICAWDLIRCSCTKICRQIADIFGNQLQCTESTGGYNKFSVGFIALCKTLFH